MILRDLLGGMGWFLLIILALFVASCSMSCDKSIQREDLDSMKPTQRAVYEKMIW